MKIQLLKYNNTYKLDKTESRVITGESWEIWEYNSHQIEQAKENKSFESEEKILVDDKGDYIIKATIKDL